jgi:hypothetical protein
MIGLLSLVVGSPSATLASTGRWISAEADPGKVVVRCRREGALRDVQTRDSIARRYALTDHVQGVAEKIGLMRRAGYRVSGPTGRETLDVEVPFQGVFQQPVAFRVRATLTELHLYGRFEPGGTGRIVADRKVRPFLTEENREKITSTYEGWAREVRAGLDGLRGRIADQVFPLSDAERPDLSRLNGRAVERIAHLEFCGEGQEIRVRARWARQIDRELGR